MPYRDLEDCFQQVFNLTPELIAVITENGSLVEANIGFLELLSFDKLPFKGRSILEEFDIVKGDIDDLITDNRRVIVKFKREKDLYFSVSSKNFKAVTDHNLTILSFTDITDIEEEKDQLQKMAIIDDLTGVYNRRYFNSLFSDEVNRFKRSTTERYLSFFIADIDNFKIYNDTYGHQAGDYVLKKVAQKINQRFNRGSDAFFRLGGEEFGAIYLSKNINESILWAERVRNDIEYLYIEHRGNRGGIVTLSIGLFSTDIKNIGDLTPDKIYNLADKALYEAKSGGRNRVGLYADHLPVRPDNLSYTL